MDYQQIRRRLVFSESGAVEGSMEEVSFEEEKLAQIKCTPEEAKERITRCKELIQLTEEARDKAKFQASLELYQKAQAI